MKLVGSTSCTDTDPVNEDVFGERCVGVNDTAVGILDLAAVQLIRHFLDAPICTTAI